VQGKGVYFCFEWEQLSAIQNQSLLISKCSSTSLKSGQELVARSMLRSWWLSLVQELVA